MNDFQRQGTLCDVKIKVGCEEIPAHKNILAANSEYFKNKILDSDEEVIEVDGKAEVFQLLLDFMYTRKNDGLTADNFKDVLVMAASLELRVALKMCQNFFDTQMHTKSMSVQRAYELSLLGDLQLSDLSAKARRYMVELLTSFMASSKFSGTQDFLEQTTVECLEACLEKIQLSKLYPFKDELDVSPLSSYILQETHSTKILLRTYIIESGKKIITYDQGLS